MKSFFNLSGDFKLNGRRLNMASAVNRSINNDRNKKIRSELSDDRRSSIFDIIIIDFLLNSSEFR